MLAWQPLDIKYSNIPSDVNQVNAVFSNMEGGGQFEYFGDS